MKNVAIIDYEVGNLFSVKQACLTFGVNAFLTSNPKEIMAADKVILPGVGAFGRSMENLKKFELDKVLNDYVGMGKPLMGICLGLQLLFESSDEFGHHEGLGLLKGSVNRFPSLDTNGDKLLVPQISWNKAKAANLDLWNKSPLKSLSSETYFYFVHSYFVTPKENIELSTTNYGGLTYCSSIIKDNIFAVQFHPEKSGEKGLEIYKNWLGV